MGFLPNCGGFSKASSRGLVNRPKRAANVMLRPNERRWRGRGTDYRRGSHLRRSRMVR